MTQQAWPSTEPTEVVLAAGDARLAVDLRGGGLRRLVVDDWDVLDGYPAGAVADGLARRACCVPWPNRVRDGRWNWHGRGPPARRGLARRAERHARPGRAGSRGPSSTARRDRATRRDRPRAARGLPVPARPSPSTTRSDRTGSTVTMRVRNVGDRRRPVRRRHAPVPRTSGRTRTAGIGGAELTVPARTALETDGGLPTGARHRFHGDVGRIGAPGVRHPAHRPGAGRRRLGPAAAARPAGRARARRRRVAGRGCRSTAATACRTGSAGAASPWSR